MSYTLKYEILSETTCEVDKLEGETTEVVIPEYITKLMVRSTRLQ